MNHLIKIEQLETYNPKFVVCYSGGHSSAICAINAVLKHGKDNVILLNHDISPEVETSDIKRFKKQVADYLGLSITYANHQDWESLTPIKNAIKIGGWKFNNSPILCTYHLKTEPFYKWIAENDPDHLHTYLYGFDKNEQKRINTRVGEMQKIGCKTNYPLVTWGKLSITTTEQIGIQRPNNYENFKHANCQGCLKAGWQHWYIVYCHRPDLWQQTKDAEDKLGYALHKDDKSEPVFLVEREELFEKMKRVGVPTTEHIASARFWQIAKRWINNGNLLAEINSMKTNDEMACISCTG